MIVYQCIEASGDQGIWIRDIKVQTSLHAVFSFDLVLIQSAINRAIEKMVKRKLIKSFKSIASKMKIMYILYDKGIIIIIILNIPFQSFLKTLLEVLGMWNKNLILSL